MGDLELGMPWRKRSAAFVVAALAACSSATPAPATPATQVDAAGRALVPTPHAVSVTKFTPDHGETAGGTMVRFEGTDLEGRAIRVYFGTRPGRVVSVALTEFVVEAPGGVQDEVVPVRVVIEGDGEQTLKQSFTFANDAVAPKPRSGAQAEIAAKLNTEGEQLLAKGDYAGASAKFREAVARVPEARFWGNLCLSLTAEHKHGDARTACDAYAKASQDP